MIKLWSFFAGALKDFHLALSCLEESPSHFERRENRPQDLMTTYARCAGCNNGGSSPPNCAIRICARERGYELCSSCADLEGCTRFDWIGEHGQQVKDKRKESR